MKISKKILIANAAAFAAFAAAWCWAVVLYQRLLGCLIEIAHLKAGAATDPSVYTALCSQTGWQLSWVFALAAPIVSVASLAYFVWKEKIELGWISVVAIHFLCSLLLVLLSLNAWMYVTWGLWT